MEFTGNNKKAFAKYLRKQRFGILFDPEKSNNPYVVNLAEMFEKLHISMQFGVVQDYADSIGYEIGIKSSDNGFAVYFNDVCMQTQETRDEARLAAIKAFDEIVNAE